MNERQSVGDEVVEVHLTGFGSFHGVSDNPSQILAEYYKQHLDEHGLTSSTVLQVSTEEAKRYLEQMKQYILNKYNAPRQTPKKIIFLHLGVSASSKRYEIETRAKNEASFRAPDERKYQPMNETIDGQEPLQSWRYTLLPIELITERVNQTLSTQELHFPLQRFSSLSVIEATKNPLPFGNGEQQEEVFEEESLSDGLFLYQSQDAGLFLCNYLYYASLKVVEELNRDSGGNFTINSIFVHIPSHKTIPINQQRVFMDTLLKTILNI